MTKYCLQERAKVYNLYLEHLKLGTKESYINYIKVIDNFEYRFKKRYDPLNLVDEYDILGYTLWTVNGKFIPMELR